MRRDHGGACLSCYLPIILPTKQCWAQHPQTARSIENEYRVFIPVERIPDGCDFGHFFLGESRYPIAARGQSSVGWLRVVGDEFKAGDASANIYISSGR